MPNLKKTFTPLLSLFLLLLTVNGFAQGITIAVNFSNKTTTSNTHYYKYAAQNAFVGLSAYCKNTHDAYQLHYSIKQGDVWSEWISLSPYTEGELSDRKSFEAAPITQHFEAIKFKSSAPLTEPVFFRLFQADVSDNYPNQNGSTTSAACSCETPSFCNRECWCPSGNCPVDSTPSYTNPSHIIIHHSAGFNNSNDFKAVVAYYWDFHVNTNGWDDISYNWLIDADGAVYQGRGNRVQGAHFSCMNSGTLGICMIGDFQNQEPTPAALASLKNLLAAELCDKSLDPSNTSLHQSSRLNLPTISSHLDGNTSTASNSCASGTVCPGNEFYKLLPQLRTEMSTTPCLALGINSRNISSNNFIIAPNPSTSLQLSIQNTGLHYLVVSNLLGEVIFVNKINNSSANGNYSLELNVPNGVYLIKLSNQESTQIATWLKQ